MQSLRLLQELNSNGAGAAVTKRMIDGEEGFPINVQVFPSTSAKSHQMPAGEENLAQEKEEERMEVLCNGKMEEMPKVGEPMEVGIAACDFDAKMEEEEEPEEEDEVREEWEEEEEEEDEPLSEEEMARRRRRDMFPTETLDEICRFMAFSECARTYTTNRLFQALLEPRRKVCMEVFIKRLDDTRQRLDKTIQVEERRGTSSQFHLDGHNLHLIKENLKEVNERRQHVNQLSEHIGVINARLEAMGNNLAVLDAQIVDNHSRLDALNARIERMRVPIANVRKPKAKEEEEGEEEEKKN